MDKTLILVKRYDDYLMRVFQIVKEHEKNVCYVTFNKTPEFILESAEKNQIPRERFYFIDGITARIKSSSSTMNSVQIHEFDNLKTIDKNIKAAVSKGYTLVIFDSISNVLIYHSLNDASMTKFLDGLFEFLSILKGDVVFVCNENDIGNYSLDKTISRFNAFIKPHAELFGI